MTPKFLLADSDPDASLPFVVHTQSPQFFALLTPKFRGSAASLLESGDFRSALRGINLYPGFLTNPAGLTATQMMLTFYQSAHFMIENAIGAKMRQQVKDEDISIVWRESGTYAPKHLFAETETGQFVIRTEHPRLIVHANSPRGEIIIWQETASLTETASAIAEAQSFREEYLDKELAT